MSFTGLLLEHRSASVCTQPRQFGDSATGSSAVPTFVQIHTRAKHTRLPDAVTGLAVVSLCVASATLTLPATVPSPQAQTRPGADCPCATAVPHSSAGLSPPVTGLPSAPRNNALRCDWTRGALREFTHAGGAARSTGAAGATAGASRAPSGRHSGSVAGEGHCSAVEIPAGTKEGNPSW